MPSRIGSLAALTLMAVAVVALGYITRYFASPNIGDNFPQNKATAEKAKIVNVSGSTPQFPQGGFVLPSAVPGMIVQITATRATHDWDTRESGDTCPPQQDPVEDDLHPDWPRWDPGHGDAHFLPRYPGDISPYDKGIWVMMRAPEAATDDPQGFFVRVYEEDKYTIADDYAMTPWYGQLQDAVQMHVCDLVTLHIWDNGRAVSVKQPGSVPEGPDAYNKLGLFHAIAYSDSGTDAIDWSMFNTVNSEYQFVDPDKTGSAVYDGDHMYYWETIRGGLSRAYGTGLKTEICATINLEDSGAPTPLPADVRTLMEGRLNWELYQEYKSVLIKNGSIWAGHPDNKFTWTPDFAHSADDEHMEYHYPTTVVSDAWLYEGDAPGPYLWRGLCSEGDVVEIHMMFRTGVRLKDSTGNVYTLVDANDHVWKAAGKMLRTSIRDPDEWIITEPMHPGGEWTIP